MIEKFVDGTMENHDVQDLNLLKLGMLKIKFNWKPGCN